MTLQTKYTRIKRLMSLILTFGLLGVSSLAIAATKINFSDKGTIVKEIKFGGDLRLRQENFDNSGTKKDRQRQRIRLRLGVDVKLPNNLKVKTRFATGGVEQTSTNQTFDENATPKAFSLDRAYLEWKPFSGAKIQGGKMKNPFWTNKSSDLMWDTDFNPEGLSQSFEGLLGSVGLFANLGQFAIEERSSSLEDAYQFTEQVGAEFKMPAESRIKVGVAHHEFTNVRNRNKGVAGAQGDIGGSNSFGTNTSSAPFSIVELTTVITTWIGGIPLSFQAMVLQNYAAPKTTVGGLLTTADEQNTAVHAGLIVGKAKKKGNFEVAYFYKEIEKDAAVAGITDADMPNTTNTKGHIGWIGYKITDFISAKIKHYDAEPKVRTPGSVSGDIRRTQFDLSLKF